MGVDIAVVVVGKESSWRTSSNPWCRYNSPLKVDIAVIGIDSPYRRYIRILGVNIMFPGVEIASLGVDIAFHGVGITILGVDVTILGLDVSIVGVDKAIPMRQWEGGRGGLAM